MKERIADHIAKPLEKRDGWMQLSLDDQLVEVDPDKFLHGFHVFNRVVRIAEKLRSFVQLQRESG